MGEIEREVVAAWWEWVMGGREYKIGVWWGGGVGGSTLTAPFIVGWQSCLLAPNMLTCASAMPRAAIRYSTNEKGECKADGSNEDDCWWRMTSKSLNGACVRCTMPQSSTPGANMKLPTLCPLLLSSFLPSFIPPFSFFHLHSSLFLRIYFYQFFLGLAFPSSHRYPPCCCAPLPSQARAR